MLPAVDATSLPADKALGFEPIQQTGDPWGLLDHALRDLQGRQTLIASAPKDPQHVVLLQRDAMRLDDTHGVATDEVGRSQKRQNGLLGDRPKRASLLKFALQRARLSSHANKITCQ